MPAFAGSSRRRVRRPGRCSRPGAFPERRRKMATLVLTAVGTAIGGPIGGAIGSIAGQILDREGRFAPKPIHGARLGDLAVETSSYGAAIPKIIAKTRVARTVIWATDLMGRRP